MTEEETFNTLKRRSFMEVYNARTALMAVNPFDIKVRQSMYRDMGWDVDEFRKELRKELDKYLKDNYE